jgi:hypothetical protein
MRRTILLEYLEDYIKTDAEFTTKLIPLVRREI